MIFGRRIAVIDRKTGSPPGYDRELANVNRNSRETGSAAEAPHAMRLSGHRITIEIRYRNSNLLCANNFYTQTRATKALVSLIDAS